MREAGLCIEGFGGARLYIRGRELLDRLLTCREVGYQDCSFGRKPVVCSASEKMEGASPLFLLDLVPMGYSWRTVSSLSFQTLFFLLLPRCKYENCTQKLREHAQCDGSIMDSFVSRKQHLG